MTRNRALCPALTAGLFGWGPDIEATYPTESKADRLSTQSVCLVSLIEERLYFAQGRHVRRHHVGDLPGALRVRLRRVEAAARRGCSQSLIHSHFDTEEALPVVALPEFAFAGLCNPFINVPLTTNAPAVIPDEKRGKEFVGKRVGITGVAPLGIAVAGPLVDRFGPVAVLFGMSGIVVLAGISGLFVPLIRIDSVDATADPDD